MKCGVILWSCLTILIFPSNASPLDNNVNYAQCQAAVQNGSHNLVGAVDEFGNPVAFINQTDGLLYPQCISFCGDGWQSSSYTNASTAVTNWLFPWLVLVAQLPFQTRGTGNDILSAFLIIGSPILAMYSLLVTLWNSRWIYQKCKERDIWGRYAKNALHMSEVAFILSTCQQVPLRIGDTTLLACSIVLHRNEAWWEDLAARLQDSARTFPESLWPQMFLVIATYTLTLIYSFSFEAGDNYTGLGMSVGMAWSWTFPMVLGWYSVGTQMKRNSIERALEHATDQLEIPLYVAARNSDPQIQGQPEMIRPVRRWSGMQHPLAGPLAQYGGTKLGETNRLWGTFCIAGNQESLGPIFNYARLYTWQRIAVSIVDAHHRRRLPDNIVPLKEEDLRRLCYNTEELQDQSHPYNHPPRTRTIEMERGTGPSVNHAAPQPVVPQGQVNPNQPTPAQLAPMSFPPTTAPGGGSILFIAAVIFHFFTTVPAVLNTYYKPPVGLGCHSGSLLLYFAASLLSASSLAFSAWLSKRWFQLKEQDKLDYLHFWAFFAVTTRLIGTWLSYANALWILIYCMLEFVGFFQRCYCDCLWIVKGDRGWLSFLSTAQIEQSVLAYWKGSVALSLIFILSVSVLLWWLPRDYIKSGMRKVSRTGME